MVGVWWEKVYLNKFYEYISLNTNTLNYIFHENTWESVGYIKNNALESNRIKIFHKLNKPIRKVCTKFVGSGFFIRFLFKVGR